jgi:WD40 repeat protein
MIKESLKKPLEKFENITTGIDSVRQMLCKTSILRLSRDWGAVHNDGITCFAFAADEKYAFSVSFDRKMIHWNIQKGTKSFDCGPIHTDKINSIAVTRNGKWALTISRDRRMKQFNMEIQKVAKQVKLEHDYGVIHEKDVNDICLSYDSKTAWTVGHDGFMREWNLQKKEMDYEWPGAADCP